MSGRLDYIIIGQGLAGSILAYTLINRGCSIKIFDDGNNSASVVAAGMFNPITGKRWVVTWKAGECFSKLSSFYPSMQEELKSDFYFPKKLFRPFATQREQNEWTSKSQADLDSRFIDRIVDQPVQPDILNNPLGGVFIKNAGYIDVPQLLKKIRMKFNREGILIREKFDEDQLILNDDIAKYQGFNTRKIIYCNGITSMYSRYFSWLPFNPVKGEILTAELNIKPDFIISRGIFVIPEPGNRYKVGATYDRGIMNTDISDSAREFLTSRLSKLISTNIRIIGQVAGIRPATRDRRPFIGIHPVFKTMGIFNGFGSKGVSLIPYLSDIFADHLLSGDKLEPGINIIRYFN